MANVWWNEEASEPVVRIETPDLFAIGSVYRREVDIPAREATYVNARGELVGGMTDLSASEAEFLASRSRPNRW